MSTLAEQKAELRRRMRRLRSDVPVEERARWSAAAAQRLMSYPGLGTVRTAFVFHSFGSEISTADVLAGLAARGVRLSLPLLVDGVLEAAAYGLGDPLAPSAYGALQPERREILDPAAVDLIVAPGLAFDPGGHRLGYGGGYYDGFLTRARPGATRVGFGFDLQVVDSVPHGERDERLDAVVTEERTIVAPAP